MHDILDSISDDQRAFLLATSIGINGGIGGSGNGDSNINGRGANYVGIWFGIAAANTIICKIKLVGEGEDIQDVSREKKPNIQI